MPNDKNKRKKISLVSYDPVEDPETIIATDKDNERKEAFRKANDKIKTIIPEYFAKKRRKSNSGGTAFSKNIVVTQDKEVVQTNEVKQGESTKEAKEIGD